MKKQLDDKKKKVTKKKKVIKDLDINNKKINKKDKESKNSFSLRELIIIVILTCILSSLCTGCIMFFKYKSTNVMTKYSLNKDNELNRFVEVYANVLKDYYEDVNSKTMIDNAIKAMLGNLGDAYTSYLTKEEAKALTEKLEGEYKGIGIQITGRTVYSVFEGSPADKAGIKAGDVLNSVNGKEVTDENYAEITNIIKTGDDDTFIIKALRDDEELSFEVSRTTLDVPAISYQIIENKDKNTGYIYIETFSNTVAKQISNALNKMEDEGIDNLIIDVRGNTGGYLSAADDISELFLQKGKVIYSLESKLGKKSYKDTTDDKREYKVVVLINGASASSSEILAAALKDSYGALLVGNKSYGKGKVQSTKNFKDGSMAKYTSSKWLRPNGECIDGEGLIPDYEVDLKISEDGKSYIDTQLNKALEILQ